MASGPAYAVSWTLSRDKTVNKSADILKKSFLMSLA